MGWESWGYDCGRDYGSRDKSKFPKEMISLAFWTALIAILSWLAIYAPQI